MPANKKPGYAPQTNESGPPVFWIATVLLWVVWVAWLLFRPGAEVIEEFYSRGFYRFMVAVISPLTETVSFSIALVIVIFLLGVFPLMWVVRWGWIRWRKRGSHLNGFFWGVKWLLFLVPFVVVWFLLFWGIGYQRPLVETRLDFDTATIEDTEAQALMAMALAIIERDQPKTPADRDVERAVAAISAAMEEVVGEWDDRPIRLPRRVKATPSGLLIVNSSAGICAPITLEPHVDGALPDTSYVGVAAHELAHVAGLCVEAEATLVGFVAGLRADDPYARYAVALDIYTDLYRSLPAEGVRAAVDALPEVAREDLAARREVSRHYHELMKKFKFSWLGEANRKVYNQYLKSQGIEEGVRNYGKGVTLFAYAWRKGLVAAAGEPEVPVPTPPGMEADVAPDSPLPEAGDGETSDAEEGLIDPAIPEEETEEEASEEEGLEPINPAE